MDYREAIDKMFDSHQQGENECPICGTPQKHEKPCSDDCREADLM